MYLPRLSTVGTDKGFFDNEYGYNDVDLNMPNCTDGCLKRASEIAGKKVKEEMFGKGATGNAKDWIKNCKWDSGSVIKEGSILDYDGTYGHVLTIERIVKQYSPTHCLCEISQSNYTRDKKLMERNYYQILTYDIQIGVKTNGVGLIPKGCIYNPYVNDKRVQRNTSRHQLEITYERLKARDSKGNWIEGRYIPMGIFNVDKSKKMVIDGIEYKAYELDTNVYACLVDGCYVDYEVDTKDYKVLYEEAQSKLDKIKGIL